MLLIVHSTEVNLASNPLTWFEKKNEKYNVILCDSNPLSQKVAAKLFSELQGGFDIRYDFKSPKDICGYPNQAILVMTRETADKLLPENN